MPKTVKQPKMPKTQPSKRTTPKPQPKKIKPRNY